ncbi:MAG: AraC family transcriptional regulator, partial [Spirochaetaceae bacterium]
ALPIHVPPGPACEPIAATMVAALTAFRTDALLARLKLWEALVLLSHLSEPDRAGPAVHPAVEAALTWIDLHLPEPCTLGRIAEESGVSVTHLNRLFAGSLGVSVMRYLRNRRMELAHYLLITTGLAVKDVAYQVGIPDLHAFNKLCKAYFGLSPTAIRRP